jgi:EamA domain-containing membrane protein RarD
VTWPLLTALALVAVALIWRERARRAQMMALIVAAVALGYAWINLGKV